jgi:hypothetical protein
VAPCFCSDFEFCGQIVRLFKILTHTSPVRVTGATAAGVAGAREKVEVERMYLY